MSIRKHYSSPERGKPMGLPLLVFLFSIISPWAVLSNPPQPQQNNSFNTADIQAYHNALSLRKGTHSPTQEIPLRPASLYIDQLEESLELIITEEREKYEPYKENWEKRLAYFETMDEHAPYRLFYLAESRLQWAFVEAKFGNELSAALNMRQAYRLINKNKAAHPQFLPNNKTLGLLHIIFSTVPEKYHWTLSLLGVEGDEALGLEELRSLDKHPVFGMEVKLLLCGIQAYLMQESASALLALAPIAQKHPENLLIKYLHTSILMKNAQGDAALSLLQTIDMSFEGYLPFHTLNYLLGETLLQKGEYRQAVKAYQMFLDRFQGENLIKDAYYKLFLCHWLRGDTENTLRYQEQAKHQGQAYVEADKHAQKALKNNEKPNKAIMKIRMATDGGHYGRAQGLVQTYQSRKWGNKKDHTEFIYRQARLYHKTDQPLKAIRLYLKTIEQSVGENWYFAPNSALQLGYLYQKKGEKELSRKYLRKALSYKKHEYKNSIDSKAKSALNDME